MSYSYEGIGQWCATFGCQEVGEGQVVKMADSGQVAVCQSGDEFCGVAVAMGRDEKACAVALGGMVTVSYTGTVPAVGWNALAADGNGGVAVGSAERKRLVVDVDDTNKKVTFML